MDFEIPFRAYQGRLPYLFVSYAHANVAEVYPELQWLNDLGYRIWYDEGIPPGTDWPDVVGSAIENCAQMVVFLTEESVGSHNVLDEVFMARGEMKPVLYIFLDETSLPAGLKLVLGRKQSIYRYELPSDLYRQRVIDALEPTTIGDEEALLAKPPDPNLMRREVCVSGSSDPDRTVRENSLGMEFVWCPPGAFTMGSPDDEYGRHDGEVQHSVELTRGFWIARHPVTQLQWELLMGHNPSYFKISGPVAPVECVNWDDAVEFCRRLSLQEKNSDGPLYSLPTEAQWEYACRAGTTGPYSAASSGWFFYNSEGRTHTVGIKTPNPWGIFDMHGNVFEWCLDWYGPYPLGLARDPCGPNQGLQRIIRGGSWSNDPLYCRSAYRFGFKPGNRCRSFGFRPVIL